MTIRVYPSFEELSQRFDFNPDTGEFTYKLNIIGTKIKKGTVTKGNIDSKGYYVISIKKIQYKAHRLGWILFYGNIDNNLFIDHINGLRNDNRISNLRLVTMSENSQNASLSQRNKFGVTGVRFNPHIKSKCSPYEAHIQLNGKRYTKVFKTKEEAIEWRLNMQKNIYNLQPVQRHLMK